MRTLCLQLSRCVSCVCISIKSENDGTVKLCFALVFILYTLTNVFVRIRLDG